MFPELLVERMIEAATNPGDLVLDIFMGSGTTGSVAKRLKRNYIGFELNPNYVKIAEKRIKETPIVYDIFDFLEE